MVAFLLVPGAGGDATYWSELVPRLTTGGHEAIAVDIAEDNPALGLPEYATIVSNAADGRREVVLVAQSMGGFTAPMVPVDLRALIFVNAMIPVPGETPGEWFAATGASQARREIEQAAGRGPDFDAEWSFLHDVPADVLPRLAPSREPADTPFGQPCTFTAWPDVPTHVVVGRDDRFFPADLQVRVARERLGLEPRVVPGGHLLALANAAGLAAVLLDTAG
ncbi:alpha/beta fold hydrolase [uncultured Jatrophihabitans sp.]|uniref:alpha/beta fold hydrolase n=1 Tax=uncultured Jatrophihabitans sp. TaxID=1610747 RepID=UPI0035CBA492